MGRRGLIVLDTHAWLWFASESPKLSRRARLAVRHARTLGVHPISCWEIAMLVDRGHLRLGLPVESWIRAALERPRIELLSLTPEAAVRAARLGADFPNDPADRFIVSAALELGAPVVSRDTRIQEWGGIAVVW